MKPKVLLITRDFSPITNGTVSCLRNIVKELANYLDVTIVSTKRSSQDLDVEELDGATIYRAFDTSDQAVVTKFTTVHKLGHSNLPTVAKKVAIKLVQGAFEPMNRLAKQKGYYHYVAWQNNIPDFVECTISLEEYQGILAVGAPFENIRAASQLKQSYPGLHFGIIQFDSYAFNPVEIEKDKKTNQFQTRLQEEMNWYESADFIIPTLEMVSTIETSELKMYTPKIHPMGMPNLVPLVNSDALVLEKASTDDIHIVYTGMFYEDIRNPTYTLDLFTKVMQKNSRIKLHLIGSGCEDILYGFKKRVPNQLLIYGNQSKEFAQAALNEAALLLNISNKTTSQAPSKIVEYIGSGKPIINVYSVENDVCNNYLENYELAYLLKEKQSISGQDVDALLQFCLEHQKSVLPFSQIEEKYAKYSPKTYVSKLTSLLAKKS